MRKARELLICFLKYDFKDPTAELQRKIDCFMLEVKVVIAKSFRTCLVSRIQLYFIKIVKTNFNTANLFCFTQAGYSAQA